MPRTPDEGKREEARRLSGLGIPRGQIAARLGVHRDTVAGWLGSQGRTGPAGRRDVPDQKVIDLRDRGSLSWAEVAALTGMSKSGAKQRYWAAKGIPRPDRRKDGAN